jgi:L-seryl-tRNA(Ser) seleniumtransferase
VSDPRRATPRTDDVLADARLRDAATRLGDRIVKQSVVDALERCRSGEIAPAEVASAALQSLPPAVGSMRPVVNATGVLVHTNLGRSPLSDAALEALRRAAGPTDVELDLETGRRAPRGRGALAALAAAVPDAEAVHAVNNGAAALALATAALAQGKSVVIARGEMVEIGDGFRIPELIESVGGTLREVGTTNRVRLDDYASALDDTTGFVLKVHPSNFVVRGFTSSVPVAELASLEATLVVDIGSGLLRPHARLADEPDAASALRAGADLVTASGDKLLGGPQAGLLLGRANVVDRLRRHPLARAVRLDKLALAALEATLAGPPAPLEQFLATDPGELSARAERIAKELEPDVDACAVASTGAVGGGSAPGVEWPSAAVAVPSGLAPALRLDERTPVLGRVEGGRLLLDLAAVPPADDELVVAAVRRAARTESR